MRTLTRPVDTANEQEVAAQIEAAFRVKVHRYGFNDPIDWWLERNGRMCGVAELKCRTHATTSYPTVFLALRKWMALTLFDVSLGLPAYFFVRFSDELRYIRVIDIPTTARDVSIGGRDDRPGVPNDHEPMVLVPVAAMEFVWPW